MSLKPITITVADNTTPPILDKINNNKLFSLSLCDVYSSATYYKKFLASVNRKNPVISGLLNDVPSIGLNTDFEECKGAKTLGEFIAGRTQFDTSKLGGGEILAWLADPTQYIHPILTDAYTQYVAKSTSRISYTLEWRVYTGHSEFGTSDPYYIMRFLACATAPFESFDPLNDMAVNIKSGVKEIGKELSSIGNAFSNGEVTNKIGDLLDKTSQLARAEGNVLKTLPMSVIDGTQYLVHQDNAKYQSDYEGTEKDAKNANNNVKQIVIDMAHDLCLDDDIAFHSQLRRAQVTFRLYMPCIFKNSNVLEWYISDWSATPSSQFKLDKNGYPIPIYFDFSASLKTTTIPGPMMISKAINGSALKIDHKDDPTYSDNAKMFSDYVTNGVKDEVSYLKDGMNMTSDYVKNGFN